MYVDGITCQLILIIFYNDKNEFNLNLNTNLCKRI